MRTYHGAELPTATAATQKAILLGVIDFELFYASDRFRHSRRGWDRRGHAVEYNLCRTLPNTISSIFIYEEAQHSRGLELDTPHTPTLNTEREPTYLDVPIYAGQNPDRDLCVASVRESLELR